MLRHFSASGLWLRLFGRSKLKNGVVQQFLLEASLLTLVDRILDLSCYATWPGFESEAMVLLQFVQASAVCVDTRVRSRWSVGVGVHIIGCALGLGQAVVPFNQRRHTWSLKVLCASRGSAEFDSWEELCEAALSGVACQGCSLRLCKWVKIWPSQLAWPVGCCAVPDCAPWGRA